MTNDCVLDLNEIISISSISKTLVELERDVRATQRCVLYIISN